MARDEKLELLRQVPLFANFGRREIERLGMLTDEIDLPGGRVLMRQDQRGDEMFVIVAGSAKVERNGEQISNLSDGDMVGEIALVDGGPRTATVTLTADSRLLVIGHSAFHSLMDEFPELRLRVLETLAHRVRQLDRHGAH